MFLQVKFAYTRDILKNEDSFFYNKSVAFAEVIKGRFSAFAKITKNRFSAFAGVTKSMFVKHLLESPSTG